MTRQIFVFGSNLAGIHGAGSARHAHDNLGAEWGVGVGLTGESYAIPTKDHNIRTMPLDDIRPHVADFLQFANDHPEMEFQIVAIGCGLAGFTPEQIGPMFDGVPANCQLPPEFLPFVDKRPHPASAPETTCTSGASAPASVVSGSYSEDLV